MSERKLAIIFGIAGVVLLIVGSVGLISALSSDDGGDTATGQTRSDPASSTSTSVGAATTRAGATTTEAAATGTTSSPSTTFAPNTVATSTTTTTTTTTTIAATTTTTITPETPEDFVNALIAAQAAGDVDFLLARLHPEVLARYGGAEPCQTYLGSTSFPAITLRETVDPAPWDYATDDVVTTFPEAIGVEIQRIVDGETIIQELHIVYAGPQLRWFTDCGDPV